MRPFYTDFTLYGDSMSWPWYTEIGFWLPFLRNDHTWFIYSAFYTICNRFLPLLLNIHPQMFYKYGYCWIMLGYYVFFFFSMRENFTKYFKPKYGVLWTLAIFPIALQALSYSGFLWAPKNDTFTLSYIFLATFFILFANMFEKIYVKNLFAETPKREWITLLVLFFKASATFFNAAFLTSQDSEDNAIEAFFAFLEIVFISAIKNSYKITILSRVMIAS